MSLLGAVSDPDDESLAAKKTKQMIARTYGKRHKKKLAMRPTVYGEVWQDEDDTDPVDHHIRVLAQFTVSYSIKYVCSPGFNFVHLFWIANSSVDRTLPSVIHCLFTVLFFCLRALGLNYLMDLLS